MYLSLALFSNRNLHIHIKLQHKVKFFYVKYKLEKLKNEFFPEKFANNMFGKKVGENRLATKKKNVCQKNNSGENFVNFEIL